MPKFTPAQKSLRGDRFMLKEHVAALNRAQSPTEANAAADAIAKTVLKETAFRIKPECKLLFANTVARLNPATVDLVGIAEAVESQCSINGHGPSTCPRSC